MDIRYKFLDAYVGESFSVYETGPKVISLSGSVKPYGVISDKGKHIMNLWVRDDYIQIFRSEPLCETISCFFGIDIDESACLVKEWFGDKFGLKKIGDLLELLPKK
jgi:hypothetical protein